MENNISIYYYFCVYFYDLALVLQLIEIICWCVQGNVCKQFAVTGTCPYGPRCRFSHQLQSLLSTTQQTPSPSRPQHTAATTPTIKTATPTKTTADWSPMDDGIEVVLPGSSAEKPASRDEVNTYINSFLYGPTTPRRRLPVFEEICPSREATP